MSSIGNKEAELGELKWISPVLWHPKYQHVINLGVGRRKWRDASHDVLGFCESKATPRVGKGLGNGPDSSGCSMFPGFHTWWRADRPLAARVSSTFLQEGSMNSIRQGYKNDQLAPVSYNLPKSEETTDFPR